MSRLISCGILAASLFLLPALGAAQVATEAELLQRIDSLAPLVEQAKERLNRVLVHRADIARNAVPTTTDTLNIDGVRVIALAEQAELASELFSEVLAEHFTSVGIRQAFSERWFTFQWRSPLKPIYVEGEPRRAERGRLTSRTKMKSAIEEAIMGALFYELALSRTAISYWGVSGALNPPKEVAPYLYRELATTASHLAPTCIGGDAMACWSLLGLDLEGDPISTWYLPEERRAVVGSRGSWVWGGRKAEPVVERCLTGHDLGACDRVLVGEHRIRLDPLSDGSRNLMVWLALDAGGPGAWARLLEDPDMDPADVLRYASGLSTEDLATLWREAVVSARPEVQAGFGVTQLFTMLWIFLLTALAVRSTRWRLG